MVVWTPPELLDRFEGKTNLRIADIAARLSCSGEEGCGSRNIAVFPHLWEETPGPANPDEAAGPQVLDLGLQIGRPGRPSLRRRHSLFDPLAGISPPPERLSGPRFDSPKPPICED